MPDSALLDVRGLTAFYGDFQALFGVSLSVAPRQVVAIIGANGAGKSTLLKLIAGTTQPTTGTVEVAGTVSALGVSTNTLSLSTASLAAW